MIDPVTHRYAEALFSLAVAEGAIDAVRADIERLGRECAQPGVSEFFCDARVSIDTRREKAAALTAGMHVLVQNFVNLLFDKHREDVLTGIGPAFKERALAAAGAAEGVVESARPLGPSEITSLATALGARLGKTVTLQNEVDPDVLGGIRVIVGSQMIDHSLRGRLEGLKKHMNGAPLPNLADA